MGWRMGSGRERKKGEAAGRKRMVEMVHQALDPSPVVICIHFCGVLFCLSYGARINGWLVVRVHQLHNSRLIKCSASLLLAGAFMHAWLELTTV